MGDAPIKVRRLRTRVYVPSSRFEDHGEGLPLIHLDQETTHHLRNVLRLPLGAQVAVFDNSGAEFEARIIESKPRRLLLKIERRLEPKTESTLHLTLVQALLKGNSFDRLLTLAAELGCSRIVPLFTSRTVPRLNKAEIPSRLERWQKIVEAAAAQCGRVKIPQLETPLELRHFLARPAEGKKLLLWEHAQGGQLTKIIAGDKPRAAIILAGPEGGFAEAEVQEALEAGFHPWGLGPRILRAEHAGPLALALLQFVCGDMG